MAYTINKSDDSILGTVNDDEINVTDADIVLIGRNYKDYGAIINENSVWILENFANSTSPARPLEGQLWWSKDDNDLKVFDGTFFTSVKGLVSSTSSPGNPSEGDIWWDSVNKQLYAWSGNSWILVGPKSFAGYDITGEDIQIIQDTLGNDHVVVFNKIDGVIISILSRDLIFTPAIDIAGFDSIYPGLNFASLTWVKGSKIQLGGDLDVYGHSIISTVGSNDNITLVPDSGTALVYGSIDLHPDGGSGKSIRYNDTWTGSLHTSYETGYCGLTYLNTSNGNFYIQVSPASVIPGDDANLVTRLSIDNDGTLQVFGDTNIDGDIIVTGNITGNGIASDGITSDGDLVVNGTVTVNNDLGNYDTIFRMDEWFLIHSKLPGIYFEETDTTANAQMVLSNNKLTFGTSAGYDADVANYEFSTTSGNGNVATFTVRRNGSDQKIWSDTDNIEWIVKTTTFTAVLSEHYMCTCDASYTVTLPASPAAGDWVVIKVDDQAETNNLTFGRNGSNIVGLAENLTIDVNHIEVRLTYMDASYGWAI